MCANCAPKSERGEARWQARPDRSFREVSAPGWCASSWAGISESGKRKYVNKTIHGTLRDAQAYLSRSQRDRDLSVFFEPSRMSLDGYLDKWLETAAKPKLRAKPHRDYEALLRRY